MTEPEIVFAHYRVKPGHEEQFKDLLREHENALRELELVTGRPTEVLLGADQRIEGPLFLEIFEWASGEAAASAHTHPQIAALWERIGDMCEERGGRPRFEFPHLHPIKL
jgi:hypothetical protein